MARSEGVALRVDHRAFALELVNERPTPRATLDAEVTALGAVDDSLGWRPWPGKDSEYPVTTLLALEAVQAAKAPEVGGLAASDQLDAALRSAFYESGQCISLLPVVLAVAESCPGVDHRGLTEALHHGRGRVEVVEQTQAATAGTFTGGEVTGSPHVFAPDGRSWHNPGVSVQWSKDRRTPSVTSQDETEYHEILDAVREALPTGSR